jgi:hypothetical protein
MDKLATRLIRPLAVAGLIIASVSAMPAPAGGAFEDSRGRSDDNEQRRGRDECGERDALERLADRLVYDLERRRYEVARGYARLYTEDDCPYTYAAMGSCYGNNPAAPYIMPIVPSWPEEYIDPSLLNAFGPTIPGHSSTYRLDPREAIVIFGTLPPPARYFGLQSYLLTREDTFDTTSEAYVYLKTYLPDLGIFFATVPGNSDRIQSFSSLSNAINNTVIERQSGASFGRLRFFVITPDQAIDEGMRHALRRLSVRSRDIFTEPIPWLGPPRRHWDKSSPSRSRHYRLDFHRPERWPPSGNDDASLNRLGLGEHADDYLTLMRYAMPDDEQAGDAWRAELPLVVLRVREGRWSRHAARPYPPAVVDARTADSELGLTAAIDALADAVCARWGQSCPNDIPEFTDLQTPPIRLVGPECRAIGMNCLGDTQDATYKVSEDLSLDGEEVHAVLGTLATETGNATYVGLSVNESARLKGVENVPDAKLTGTAGAYTGVVPSADRLFVYYFTRNCAGLEGLTDGHCFSISDSSIAYGGLFKLVQRAYMRPGTVRGPDSALMLNSRLITFTRP